MNESIAIEQASSAPTPESHRHSAMGVTSFVLGVLTVLMMIGVFVLSVALAAANHGAPPDEHAPQTMMLGLLGILTVLLSLFGIGFGIAAAVQKSRRRTLGIVGLCLNGAAALLIIFLVIIGLTVHR